MFANLYPIEYKFNVIGVANIASHLSGTAVFSLFALCTLVQADIHPPLGFNAGVVRLAFSYSSAIILRNNYG